MGLPAYLNEIMGCVFYRFLLPMSLASFWAIMFYCREYLLTNTSCDSFKITSFLMSIDLYALFSLFWLKNLIRTVRIGKVN